MAQNIYFENNFDKLKTVLSNTVFDCTKICVVTDKNIDRLYMKNKISNGKIFYYICDAGESTKSFETVKAIYKFLIENKFSRSDYLIAFGGGVIGDLVGFVASTFMRGIKFINIPTTLLAQTDSSIGNKNGINFNDIKNIIGTFYEPEIIYINISLLSTLPNEEISNGMAEIIKHSLLDKDFFKFMLDTKNITYDEKSFLCALKMSVCIKLNIIENDMLDINNRRFLNLGHTFGHAFEIISGFSHGKSVALGIVFALYLSCLNGLDNTVLEKTIYLLNSYGLPTKINHLDKKSIYEKMFFDKKVDNGKLNIVLLNKIGEPIICDNISQKQIFEAMYYLER